MSSMVLTLLVASAVAVALSHGEGGFSEADNTGWFQLNDGHMFPPISLGTCCGSSPAVGVKPWTAAGGVGIDTSIDYRDEAVIAAQLVGVNRSSVYITTKVTAGCGTSVSDCSDSPLVALESVKQSLENLNTTYIDMVLLHRPCEQFSQKCSIAPKLSNCTGPNPIANPTAANNGLWQGLMQAKKMGLVKSIGVSNYFPGQLAALQGDVPALNQAEMSIEGYDNDTIAYCQAHNILYESYGAMRGCPFSSPEVGKIAAAHNVTTAQVCLKWVLQRGVAIAAGTGNDPSTVKEYTNENLDLFGFELGGSEMILLNNMQL